MWFNFLQVFLGAGIGGSLRYLCTLCLPAPILMVNIVGSLLIGLSYQKLSHNYPGYLPLVNAGLLGGFTTFSSFSLELFEILIAGQILKASLYILFSVLGSLLATFIGYRLGMLI